MPPNHRAAVLPLCAVARWQPATFFVRKAEAPKQARNRRVVDGDTFGIGKRVAQFVMSRSCATSSRTKSTCAASLPVPEGRPIGATFAAPVLRTCRAHRPAVAADTCNRRAASRLVKPSLINRANQPQFLWQRCWHDPILPIRGNHRSTFKGIPPIQTFLETLYVTQARDCGGSQDRSEGTALVRSPRGRGRWGVRPPELLLADKACDANRLGLWFDEQGAVAVIPSTSSRRVPATPRDTREIQGA